jgi:hypothetical protein
MLSDFTARRQALNDLGRRITAQINLRGATLGQEIVQLRRTAQFLAQLQSGQDLTHAKVNSGIGASDEASEAPMDPPTTACLRGVRICKSRTHGNPIY